MARLTRTGFVTSNNAPTRRRNDPGNVCGRNILVVIRTTTYPVQVKWEHHLDADQQDPDWHIERSILMINITTQIMRKVLFPDERL